jgi:S-adenosylmethionine synthetase
MTLGLKACNPLVRKETQNQEPKRERPTNVADYARIKASENHNHERGDNQADGERVSLSITDSVFWKCDTPEIGRGNRKNGRA